MEVVFHALFIQIPFTIILLIAVENSVDWPVCHSFVSSFDITSRMIKDQVLRSWLVGQMCQECKILVEVGIGVMVFNATFHNISVISWLSVLLVEEAGVNHKPAVSHIMWHRVHLAMSGFELTPLVVICTTGGCKILYTRAYKKNMFL